MWSPYGFFDISLLLVVMPVVMLTKSRANLDVRLTKPFPKNQRSMADYLRS